MYDVFFQTGLFFLYIAIGYSFKKIKLLRKEDSQILSTIIMNLTLPCLFFSSANGIELDSSFFIFMLLGLIANIFMIFMSYLLSLKEEKIIRATYMIACSGYDVGNFILPFITVFFSGLGVIYLCSFNIMNVVMSMGITYAIANSIVYSQSQFNMKIFLKKLFRSISFDVYIIIIFIACFHITIPESLLKITSSIGSVNSFLVMIMIGLKLEFHMKKSEFKQMSQILSLRFIGAILLSIITFLLPIPVLAKEVFCITYFGPLISVSSVYARDLGYQGDVVAGANTISIVTSMIMTTILISIFIG